MNSLRKIQTKFGNVVVIDFVKPYRVLMYFNQLKYEGKVESGEYSFLTSLVIISAALAFCGRDSSPKRGR